MTLGLYGKKMFIADLIITTSWAMFTFRYSMTWLVLIYILMRITLCFEMNRKSPWVLYSAIVFLLCAGGLACSDVAIYPVKRIAYYIGTWMGYGSDVVEELCVWIECYEPIAGTIMSGLVLCFLPIIYWSAYNRNRRSAVVLLAKDKTISLYVGFVILLSLCLFIGMEEITFVKSLPVMR